MIYEDAAVAELIVGRSGPATTALSLELVTESDSAEIGLDFTPVQKTLRIDAGVEWVSFQVPILDDGIVERNESFWVHAILRDPSGAEVHRASALVTIWDNEMPASIDERFRADLSEEVSAVIEYPNGQLLVATGSTGVTLVRLHADGSRDTAFRPLDGWEYFNGLWLLPDEKVLVRGCRPNPEVPCRSLTRLDRDGNLDLSYVDAGLALHYGTPIEVLPDGAVIAANPDSPTRLLRLRPDGTRDPDFAETSLVPPDEGTGIWTIVSMTDGDLLVLVRFDTLGDEVRQVLIRLNPDGTVDQNFRFAEEFRVTGILSAPAGRAYLIGWEMGDNGGLSLLRILPGGARDSSFRASIQRGELGGTFFFPSLVQADSGMLGMISESLVRLDANGLPDRSYPPAAQFARVVSNAAEEMLGPPLVQLRDGGLLMRLVTGGKSLTAINGDTRWLVKIDPSLTHRSSFRIESEAWKGQYRAPATFHLSESAGAEPVHGLIRRLGDSDGPASVEMITSGGTADTGTDFKPSSWSVPFEPLQNIKPLPPAGLVQDVWGEPDETLFLELRGAKGERYGETGRALLVVEDDDRPGSLDRSYQPESKLEDCQECPADWPAGIDGQGRLVTVRQRPPTGWVVQRLVSDGQPDPAWTSEVLDVVEGGPESVRLAPDGRIYLAGRFRPDWSAATAPVHLLRFHADGRRDTGFVPTFGAAEPWLPATQIGFSPDGAILVAVRGLGPSAGGMPEFRILRLKHDGITDPGFRQIRVMAEGITALIPGTAGRFWLVGGLQSVDGMQVRRHFALLNSDGSLAASVPPPGETIEFRYLSQPTAACPDGQGGLLLTGAFRLSNEAAWRGILRIGPEGTVDRSFPALEMLWLTRDIARHSDGSFFVAGEFQSVNEYVRKGLARVRSGDAVDWNFDPGDQIRSVQAAPGRVFPLPDGQVIVGFAESRRAGPMILRRFRGDRRAALVARSLDQNVFQAELAMYGGWYPVVVESSPSLEVPDWQPAWTNRAGNDLAVFRDVIPPGTSRRFYRAIVR